jgi:branched-chain amino acid transport system ATP-binding protein
LSPSRKGVTSPHELHADKVSVHFEGVRAVDEVDLVLRRGDILGLIGPNGAGKTTLVNALTGFQRPTAGRVSLDDVDVTGLAPDRLAGMGLTRTFQSVRSFGDLTAFENVEAAALSVHSSRNEARRFVWKLFDWVDLVDRAHRTAASLPYGDERKLGLIRALATGPSFLLLDEPAAGLNEAETTQLQAAIRRVRDEFGCGILVIEHDVPLIMELCERIQVLDHGKTISEGSPAQVQADRAVMEAYLGTTDGAGKASDAQHP